MSLDQLRANPVMLTDCYNLSHQRLKQDTSWEGSHLYNRQAPQIFFGFTEIALGLLSRTITEQNVKDAEGYAAAMGLKFPTQLWKNLVTDLGGRIPLKVQAVPEGTWCPSGMPFAQIQNTVDGFGELVTWWEGVFMHGFFPSSCATEAFRMRRHLESLVPKYGEGIRKRYHSFGFRGHKSLEDAYWAGSAWNLFLEGTDDFHTAAHTPGAGISSISALAHKVTQQFDNEIDCFYRAIDETEKAGEHVVALVIDTYDAYNVINNYVVHLARYAQAKGVHLVFRPDSGDTWSQAARLYQIKEKYRLDNISCIIGEGMSFAKAQEVDEYLTQRVKVPLDFVSFGIGAGFYKNIDRDTLGWAMKTAWSNGGSRMKFSEIRLKRSIPGEVAPVVTIGGKTVVVTAKEAAQIPDHEAQPLYTTTYEWRPDGTDIQVPALWQETRDRALPLLAVGNLQQEIVLSPTIEQTIEQFRERYLASVQD